MKLAFEIELKALLKKYDMSIAFDCSEYSDTHGLSGEQIVYYKNGDYEASKTTLEYGWSVSDTDIIVNNI